MRNVDNDFKIDLRTYGRQLDPKIKVNDEDFDTDNFNYMKPAFYTSLFKTIMHQVEIDSKVYMPNNTKLNIKLGVKLNEKSYKYIELGTYYVKTCERQEDTNSYRIMAYTKMKEAMIDYDLKITEKIPLRDYLIRICQRLGWNTENIPAVFINSTKLVDPILHTGIDYTFRDVLDEIATLSCSFLLFKDDDFYLRYLTPVDANIDESYLDEDNITIGEKYFINSLVFSRAEESDNIYRKDDSNITLNGLHEYRISDCQLLSTNDRADYIDEMFEYLKTLEFYTFDIQSKGILFLEACDMFNLTLNGVTYLIALLNDEINIEDGLTETLYMDEPGETETEYKYADSTDKKINQTYIIVDKQNQKIESVISNVTEQNQKIARVTQTVDELNSKISDIADITDSKESLNGTVSFEKVNQSEPIYVKIYPTGENISYLYPNVNLFPSENLFLKVRTLRFINTTTNEYVDYELPTDLLYYDAENYDEFILDYDAQTCIVNKRVGYKADGTTYLLETATTIEYDFPKIQLTDGDYTITLLGYHNAYMFVRLMSQNIYTTQFATKAELNSEISQTTSEINLSVDEKLTSYPTTTQMNSALSVKANEITSTVSKTYATKNELTTAKSEIKQTTDGISSEVSKKVGNDEIISKINQSAETVGIDANKIELSANDVLNLLAGNTINLSGKKIKISSNNFTVDENGNIEANGGKFNGGNIKLQDSGNGGYGGTSGNLEIDGPTHNSYVYSDGIIIKPKDGSMSSLSKNSINLRLYNNEPRFDMVGPSGNRIISAQNSNISFYTKNDVSFSLYNQQGGIYGTTDGFYIPDGITYGTFQTYSLEEMKKNINKFNENAIEIVKNSDVYIYNYKREKDNDKKHIGFVIGEKYRTPAEIIGNGGTGIDTYSMTSILWKAFQEYVAEKDEQINQLQNEINELKKECE